MEQKNIIIIMVAIIVVLAAVLGMIYLQSANAKEPSKIKITSNKTLTKGDSLSIKLTDLNKTPISKGVVNITVTNSKGKVVVDNVVKTDSKGKAKLDLNLKEGKYNVNVTYGGNENYTGNNTTQKLTIKEEVVQTQSSESSASSSGGNDIEGPEADSLGITKEQAMHAMEGGGNDVKYDEESGLYVMYDPKRGIYHT